MPRFMASLLIVICPAFTLAQSVVNGSFESGSTGWQSVQGLFTNSTQYLPASTPPPDGTNYVGVANFASLEQTISNLSVGQAYRFEWNQGWSSNLSFKSTSLGVTVADGSGASTTILPKTEINTPFWTQGASDPFIATNSTMTVTFNFSNPVVINGSSAFDNVKLVAAPSLLPRTTRSLTMSLLPDSVIETDLILGAMVPAAQTNLGGPLTGELNVQLVTRQTGEIIGLIIENSRLAGPANVSGSASNSLGSANVSFQNVGLNLKSNGVIIPVETDGRWYLDGIGASFDGTMQYATSGFLSGLLGGRPPSGTENLATHGTANLGSRPSLSSPREILPPGAVTILNGPNGERILDIEIPIKTLDATLLGLALDVSGFIHAQAVIAVPEVPAWLMLGLGVFGFGMVYKAKKLIEAKLTGTVDV